jgi:uncharacterized protein with HEPN domain
MPSRDWWLRIQDMLQSIDDILQRTAEMEFEDFEANRTVIKAVLYDFGIIGEASRNIPSDVRSRYPQIPWRLMADMRNVIFHEYFQVELEIVGSQFKIIYHYWYLHYRKFSIGKRRIEF